MAAKLRKMSAVDIAKSVFAYSMTSSRAPRIAAHVLSATTATPCEICTTCFTPGTVFALAASNDFTALPKTEGTLRTQKFELRAAALNQHTWDREAAGIRVE